jgi:IS30 family transposase
MQYHQITSGERYAIAALRRQGLSARAIARELGRAPSTISREVARNRRSHDGGYRAYTACERTSARRTRSRRNERITRETWELVERYLRLDWSPEQVAGFLRTWKVLRISHETIYLHVWAGKRHISERPAEAEARAVVGHWEIDTVMGNEQGRNSVLTLVERATGYLVMGKLARHCASEATARIVALIARHEGRVATVTADNGSEFHSYALVEAATGARFYFATPHHSWERGTNENTNGLIRQYLPKRQSMAHVTQADCDAIAAKLNARPRKRLGYRTPEECYARA